MGNRRKKETALWLVFLQGVGLALGIYLLLMVLASALLVGAVLPEAGAFPAAAVGCCLASWAGAMTCVRRGPWGSLAGAGGHPAAVRRRRRPAGGAAGAPQPAPEGGTPGPPGPEGRKSPVVKFTKNTDLTTCPGPVRDPRGRRSRGPTAAANLGRRRFSVH